MICDFLSNMCGKQFKSQKHSLNITGMSTLKMIFLAPCVTKHSERKSILLIKSSTNAQKRNLCSLTLYLNDPECSYHTTSVSNLNAHKKRVHEKTVNAIQQLVFKFACSSCDFKTSTKYNLKKHEVTCKKSVELLPSEKSCNHCRKTFSTQNSLKRHTKVHNKDKRSNSNKE